MIEKIIDTLKGCHTKYIRDGIDYESIAQEILALKYQIAREVWDEYHGYETLFGDYLEEKIQEENISK